MTDTAAIIPAMIAFAVSAVSGPVLIPILTSLKMGQTERVLGVKSHLKKAGTPTMGGIMFLLGITISSLIYIWKYPKIGPVLLLTLGFGAIGFVDDYLKVVKKRSDGLFPKQKLALQVVVTLLFYVCLRLMNVSLELRVPFTGGKCGTSAFWPFLFFSLL